MAGKRSKKAKAPVRFDDPYSESDRMERAPESGTQRLSESRSTVPADDGTPAHAQAAASERARRAAKAAAVRAGLAHGHDVTRTPYGGVRLEQQPPGLSPVPDPPLHTQGSNFTGHAGMVQTQRLDLRGASLRVNDLGQIGSPLAALHPDPAAATAASQVPHCAPTGTGQVPGVRGLAMPVRPGFGSDGSQGANPPGANALTGLSRAAPGERRA